MGKTEESHSVSEPIEIWARQWSCSWSGGQRHAQWIKFEIIGAYSMLLMIFTHMLCLHSLSYHFSLIVIVSLKNSDNRITVAKEGMKFGRSGSCRCYGDAFPPHTTSLYPCKQYHYSRVVASTKWCCQGSSWYQIRPWMPMDSCSGWKTLAAYQLARVQEYKQLFTDGTSHSQNTIQNAVIEVLNNGGYKLVTSTREQDIKTTRCVNMWQFQ